MATARDMSDDFITDYEAIRKYAASEATAKITFKPSKPAAYDLIILPRRSGVFFVKYGVHWGLQDLDNPPAQGMVACLKETLGQLCPLCDYQFKLYRESKLPNGQLDPAKANKSKDLRAKSRYVMNVIAMDDVPAGVQLWEVGFKIFKQLMGVFNEWDDMLPTRAAPNQCRLIHAVYEEQGTYGNCCTSVQGRRTVKEIPIENWRESLHDLDAWASRALVSADAMRQMLVPPPPVVHQATEDTGPGAEPDDDDDDADDTDGAVLGGAPGEKPVKAVEATELNAEEVKALLSKLEQRRKRLPRDAE